MKGIFLGFVLTNFFCKSQGVLNYSKIYLEYENVSLCSFLKFIIFVDKQNIVTFQQQTQRSCQSCNRRFGELLTEWFLF